MWTERTLSSSSTEALSGSLEVSVVTMILGMRVPFAGRRCRSGSGALREGAAAVEGVRGGQSFTLPGREVTAWDLRREMYIARTRRQMPVPRRPSGLPGRRDLPVWVTRVQTLCTNNIRIMQNVNSEPFG